MTQAATFGVTPVGGGKPIPVDVRIIAATNQNLRRLIEQGHGDEDISTLFRLKDALFAAADKNKLSS